jgi:hypothetical protein
MDHRDSNPRTDVEHEVFPGFCQCEIKVESPGITGDKLGQLQYTEKKL